MSFVYQVEYDLPKDKLEGLEMGAGLERVLSYLRTLLPNYPGFISCAALYSLNLADRVRVIFQSNWQEWKDLQQHMGSGIAEDKILKEFGPHISSEHLRRFILEEV